MTILSKYSKPPKRRALSPPDTLIWYPGLTRAITEQLQSIIVASKLAVGSLDIDKGSHKDIDSHANITVAGKNIYILANNRLLPDANGFTNNHKTLLIYVVESAIKSECPYEDNKVELVISKAIHVTSMRKNLIPTFMMSKAVIQVNYTPNI